MSRIPNETYCSYVVENKNYSKLTYQNESETRKTVENCDLQVKQSDISKLCTFVHKHCRSKRMPERIFK